MQLTWLLDPPPVSRAEGRGWDNTEHSQLRSKEETFVSAQIPQGLIWIATGMRPSQIWKKMLSLTMKTLCWRGFFLIENVNHQACSQNWDAWCSHHSTLHDRKSGSRTGSLCHCLQVMQASFSYAAVRAAQRFETHNTSVEGEDRRNRRFGHFLSRLLFPACHSKCRSRQCSAVTPIQVAALAVKILCPLMIY